MPNKRLTIGRLANLASINVETIRFYQKQGLIQEPPKPDQGYRLYSVEALSQLMFIQRAKLVGFTLAEIKKLLTLEEDCNCKKAKQMAEQKLTMVNDKLNDLLYMKNTLETFICDCDNNKKVDKCPIIQSFKNNS
ncbi:MAG: MerR family transcriptional regulator [Candidatus Thioglobus sp.]|nr:MerR family transcriptional regulator [Candidatus Thioglobus pontius]MBL6977009.1 MerR family transcriptional regulator [Candidatus Thioglobus sp.]MBL6984839.1 MerR family transcriptional regulator [Candidatus Thioglobus sp.]